MTNEQYHERANAGLCVRCGFRKPLEGRRMCEVCREINLEHRHAQYMAKIKQGLCAACRKPSDGYALCKECRQKQHEQYVAKRKAMGARLFVL